MDKPRYTSEQLRHLAKIRASKMDDYLDDNYTSDKDAFVYNTEIFFDWLEKMEREEKISELLNYKFK